MAYSHWTRKGPIQGQGTEKDQWVLIYHEDISTLVRDRDRDQDPFVSYCSSFVSCTGPVPGPVQ